VASYTRARRRRDHTGMEWRASAARGDQSAKPSRVKPMNKSTMHRSAEVKSRRTSRHTGRDAHERERRGLSIGHCAVDRNRESIMIWPVQDQQWQNSNYTVCPYKPRIRLNFGATARKTPNLIFIFFGTVPGAAPPRAGVFRARAARRRAN
jgi:hypothetical protein